MKIFLAFLFMVFSSSSFAQKKIELPNICKSKLKQDRLKCADWHSSHPEYQEQRREELRIKSTEEFAGCTFNSEKTEIHCPDERVFILTKKVDTSDKTTEPKVEQIDPIPGSNDTEVLDEK